MKALITLPNGKKFSGESTCDLNELDGEPIIFTEAQHAQKVLGDSGMKGKIIIFAYPGTAQCGLEKPSPSKNYPSAAIVSGTGETALREGMLSLSSYCEKAGITLLNKVDTRGLIQELRSAGRPKQTIHIEPVKADKGENIYA